MTTRCPCGFAREVCWRCNPPDDYPDNWLDAIKDVDEDKGQTQPKKEFLDHERVDDNTIRRIGRD